jgi:hypothetical protein
VILDRIVSAANQGSQTSDFSPSVTQSSVCFQNTAVLRLCPRILVDVRVQMIVPSLSALLPNASLKLLGDKGPLLRSKFGNQLNYFSIILRRDIISSAFKPIKCSQASSPHRSRDLWSTSDSKLSTSGASTGLRSCQVGRQQSSSSSFLHASEPLESVCHPGSNRRQHITFRTRYPGANAQLKQQWSPLAWTTWYQSSC